jgi:hypothetical protein
MQISRRLQGETKIQHSLEHTYPLCRAIHKRKIAILRALRQQHRFKKSKRPLFIVMKLTYKTSRKDSLLPVPDSPNHPESPPPNIPIPGKPAQTDQRQSCKCKICDKIFNSKTEIDVHLSIEHGS